MSGLRRLLARLRNALLPGSTEPDLAREIEAHLALLADEFQSKGMSPEEARRAAERAFGGVDRAKEAHRDARSLIWLDDARRDASYALRSLRRTPGFAAVAIATLALGIGAVTVIYSVLRNVLLDPFPYRNPQRMVDVLVRDGAGNILRGELPTPEFLDFQEQSDAFDEVAGAQGEGMNLTTEAGTEAVSVIWVTPNTFGFLGVPPLLGRALDAGDARPDAPPVAVMNHRTWTTLFGGEASVVGRVVRLDGEPRTIVGVMPPRFEWHVGDFWIPGPVSRADPNAARTRRWFQAHLKKGVTIEQAAAQLNAIAARRAKAYPSEYPDRSRIQVITVIDWVVGRFRGVLYTLFGAVGLLLLIACCNVANMLLARATTREREVALRAALGASRGRLVRQLLMESAVLASGGAALGCLLADAGIRVLALLLPRSGVAWEVQLRIDRPVLVFTLVVTVLATLAFGLFPALHGARRELVAGASGGRSGTASRRHTRMRNALVIAEVAFSVVLLCGAGLLMRTFLGLVGVDLGFDPRRLLLTSTSFPPGAARSALSQRRFYLEALERLNALPGVLRAAVTSAYPPSGGMSSALEVPGKGPLEPPAAQVQFCSEQYAAVLGLELLEGRHLSAEDVVASRKVAVVNRTLATRHLGAGGAVGRSIRLPRLLSLPTPVADPTFEVIGVVADIANQGVRDAPAPQAIVPFTLRGPAALGFVVRTATDPGPLSAALRRELQAVDRDVAVAQPTTLEARLRRIHEQPRFSLVVLALFAGTGALLVGLGVYGVLAYTVAQQTRQIAIRMALGGERRHVLRMVFRTGSSLLAVGLAVGLCASLFTNRLLEAQLWRVSPQDPLTRLATMALVLTIGGLACWVPARRATRVQLVTALKEE